MCVDQAAHASLIHEGAVMGTEHHDGATYAHMDANERLEVEVQGAASSLKHATNTHRSRHHTEDAAHTCLSPRVIPTVGASCSL